MPTYDYVCRFCEHAFEHFQGLNDKKLRKCPECGRNGLDRLFGTGAGVVFKGSGFYETDYKRTGGGASSGDSGEGSGGGDTAAPKADAAKPDAKVGKSGGEAGAKKTPARKGKTSGDKS